MRKRSYVISAIVGAIIGLLAHVAFGQSPQTQLIMRATAVRVGGDGYNKEEGYAFTSYGSGVVMYEESGPLVVTCAHVVDDITGRLWYEIGDDKRPTRVLARDPDMDLAVLDARAENNGGARSAKFVPGATCYMAGFAGDGVYHIHVLTHREGNYLKHVMNEHSWPVYGGAAHKGDSGGGVYDADGNAVGVVWGTYNNQSYCTCGLPFREIIAKAVKARSSK